MSTPFDRPLTGYRWVQIRWGDTLQTIAAREIGDAGRWYDLIAYNRLRPPYLAETAADGVLAYGGLILLPAPAPIAYSALDPDSVFERDIALTNRQLLDDGAGDILVVEGRQNLAQALRHRVMTERGELLFHASYGCAARRLIGTINGPTAALLAARYVQAAIQADPRIQRVSKSEAQVVGDAINVTVEAVPIVGRRVDFEGTL